MSPGGCGVLCTTAPPVRAAQPPAGPPATLFLRSQAVTVADAGQPCPVTDRPLSTVRCVAPPRPVGTTARERRREWPVSQPRPRTIPEATVARLAVYLRVLTGLADAGRSTVSSGELAASAGVNPAGLRKDLSHLGPCGVRGVGYEVAVLRDRIAAVLGGEQSRACVLVGIGNLGSALADYAGFGTRGFEFVALFDAAPSRIGQTIGGLTVRPMEELEQVVTATRASIGVVATPAEVAQRVCDRLIAVGVRSILNFAPVALAAPAGVDVRQVDLSVELQVLAFLGAQRTAPVAGAMA